MPNPEDFKPHRQLHQLARTVGSIRGAVVCRDHRVGCGVQPFRSCNAIRSAPEVEGACPQPLRTPDEFAMRAPQVAKSVRAYGCRKPSAVGLDADVSGKRCLLVRNSFEADVHAAVWPSSV